ncbi:MAG TPA: glycosyltransferase family 4 protein [Anaerolineales bacterium]|nr:glycosyltransferase family 4 protein [Anaerolineales bacterium]
MKILMIAPQPFFEPRGTPISVFQRVSGLSNLGHTIDLVVYHLGEDVELPRVTIHRTPNLPFIKQVRVGPSWPKLPLDALLFFRSIGLLLKNHYDVIHTHEEAGVFTVFLSWLFRTPHLYDMHSSLPRQLVNFNFGNHRPIVWLFKKMERLVLKTCTAAITIGPDLEQRVRSINPHLPMVMIENLPLPIKLAGPDSPEICNLKRDLKLDGQTTVVYAGTFEKYQGVELLIDSARLVTARHPETVFILAGGKPGQIREMKQLVSDRKIQEKVVFLGTLPVEEANLYLEMADILVSPRISGTSVPLKIYTYLKMGKPIVATNLPAHNLVLDDNLAVLTNANSQAFADGLLKLVEDPDYRQYLGEQAQRLADEKYNLPNYLKKLEEIYCVFQKSLPSSSRVSTLEN